MNLMKTNAQLLLVNGMISSVRVVLFLCCRPCFITL